MGTTTTTSLTNTPQATDDSFYYTEQDLIDSGLLDLSTNIVTLDVMADDLGGNAKKLWSIDDGNASFLTDLLASNISTGWEQTAGGNRMRIVNGRIELDLSNALHAYGANTVTDLADNQNIADSFVYSIRLANGTLSWAHVSFTLVGQGLAEVQGTDGSDTLVGSDLAEVFYGGSGDDVILGGGGNDVLHGGDGTDVLIGGNGDDTLDAGGGGGVMNGGAGSDQLIAGDGADIVVFDTPLPASSTLAAPMLFATLADASSTPPSTEGTDTISGFDSAQDSIALDGAIYAGLLAGTTGHLDAGSLATITNADTGTAWSNAHIVFNTDTQSLAYVQAGQAAGDGYVFAVMASLSGNLGAGNFLLVTDRVELVEADAVLATGGLLATPGSGLPGYVAIADAAGSGGYGHFSLAADGTWSYTTISAHDEFAAGQVYRDTYLASLADGSMQLITVTLDGTNDAAHITGTSSASANETNAARTLGGALTATDVDSPATFVEESAKQLYGTFFVFSNGTWTYVMDGAHNEFAYGQSYTDTFTAHTADGTAQTISATIVGTNDPASIGGALYATLDAGAGPASGDVSVFDIDSPNTLSVLSPLSGAWGDFTFESNNDGYTYHWTYALRADAQALGMGEKQTDTLALVSGDGSRTASLTMTITGVDDPATGMVQILGDWVVGASLQATVVGLADPDGDVTLGYQWQEQVGGQWIDIGTSPALGLDPSLLDQTVRVLVTTTDAWGGQTIFAGEPGVVTGGNTAPNITGGEAILVEADSPSIGEVLFASGTLLIDDPDVKDQFTVLSTDADPNNPLGGEFVSVWNGDRSISWTYSLDAMRAEVLTSGAQAHEILHVVISDGSATATASVDIVIDGQTDGSIQQGTSGDDVLVNRLTEEGLSGGDGNDHLFFRGPFGLVDGGGGDDVLLGEPLSHLLGGDGNDLLWAQGAGAALDGGTGDDVLMVSAGAILNGGSGGDYFVFSQLIAGDPVGPTIEDLNPADGDHIFLDARVFSGLQWDSMAGGWSTDSFIVLDGDTSVGSLAATPDRPELARLVVDQSAHLYYIAPGQDGSGATLLAWIPGGDPATLNRSIGYLGENDYSHPLGSFTAQYITSAGDLALDGTAGADYLVAAPDGFDGLYGLDGNDMLFAGAGGSLLNGGAGDDILIGAAGNDQLLGGSGADWLQAGAGDDTLDGGQGQDLLYGGAGNDTLYSDQDPNSAGPGGDELHGGAGDDVLYGDVAGSAIDLFVFDTPLGPGPDQAGVDTIPQFNANGQDQIVLSNTVFKGLSWNADGSLADISFSGQASTGIHYDGTTGNLYYRESSAVAEVQFASVDLSSLHGEISSASFHLMVA